MWISRQISKQQEGSENQKGSSTSNSNGSIEVTSNGACRDVEMYAPYGYNYSLPAYQDVFLTRCDGEQTCLGVRLGKDGLASGEIKISASSGAYIYLRQDGSVVINGLIINKNGVIE